MYAQHQIPIVSSTRGCIKAIQEILQCPIVAVDCEGVNLSKDGKLCLIQIATPKRVYLFDVLKAGDKLFFDKGLRLILENKKILKVMHDCRRDSEALYFQYGIYMRGVWDTQVAYAILSQLRGNKTPYPIGLNTLFRVCSMEGNQFKDSVKHAMSAMKNFWEVRPLSRMMIDYAAGDVKNLLNVYSMLTAELTIHAHNYDFKKIIEEYSHKYVLMNICEDSALFEQDGADRSQSYNLYGIKFWDEDIGLGSKDVFAEYKNYEKVPGSSSGHRPSSPSSPQDSGQPTTQQELSCYEDGADDIEALAAEVLASARREHEQRNSIASRVVYADGYQYSKRQLNNTPVVVNNIPVAVPVAASEPAYYVRRRYY